MDSDGFTDGMETYIGTSPAGRCIPTDQEYDGRDPWPPDLNRDNRVDVQDIALELQWFGVDVNGGYGDVMTTRQAYRYDLSPEPMGDGTIDISDVMVLTTRYGQQC